MDKNRGAISPPVISVILPFYNRIDATLRAIASVEAQTYKNWELIVINDGSTDGDEQLLKEKLLTNKKKQEEMAMLQQQQQQQQPKPSSPPNLQEVA